MASHTIGIIVNGATGRIGSTQHLANALIPIIAEGGLAVGDDRWVPRLLLTGRDGGRLGHLAQLNIQVAVPHMGRIEDAHMIVCHMIGYYFMDAER